MLVTPFAVPESLTRGVDAWLHAAGERNHTDANTKSVQSSFASLQKITTRSPGLLAQQCRPQTPTEQPVACSSS